MYPDSKYCNTNAHSIYIADTAGREISHGSYETKPSFEPLGLYSKREDYLLQSPSAVKDGYPSADTGGYGFLGYQ